MTKMDLITLMTACICHDLDHPGFNNAYGLMFTVDWSFVAILT